MTSPSIRILYIDEAGVLNDDDQDFELFDFAGFLPAIGDTILHPGVLQGLSRTDPASREMLTVERRVFNPRDKANYVVLVCRIRPAREDESLLLPTG